jgi:hypothetical protein
MSAAKLSAPRVSNTGSICASVEISARGPTVAPSPRSHGIVYRVPYSELVSARLESSSLSTVHLRSPNQERSGKIPSCRPRDAIRTPPTISAQTDST